MKLMSKRRIEDRLFCPNCLREDKRIAMVPLWRFQKVEDKVYLWFICPHKRKGEKGCGHVSVKEVAALSKLTEDRVPVC